VEGVFPTCLKISSVVPIYKKGNHDSPSSYRLIYCIPVLAKVFEKVLKTRLYFYFEDANLFSCSQFGFRAGKSTVDAVDSLVDKLLQSMENGYSAQVTLCDLSKAFDCVRHDILLSKLEFYGLHGKELAIFKSYLEKRKQVVDLRGSFSKVVDVTVGVPQGSILGPILFLVLINDLSSNVSCYSTMYADDSSFLSSHKDPENLKSLINESLREANIWFQTNGLFLNEEKTKKLLVSLRPNFNMEDCEEAVKLLGIIIDSRLSWSHHIDEVCKRLSRVIFLLANLRKHVTYKYMKIAYFAFFESILRYGLIVWGNGIGIEKVLVLQKKAIRILTNSQPLEHCKPLFVETGILTVVNLYVYNILILVKKQYFKYDLRGQMYEYNIRTRTNLNYNRCRLSKTMNYHATLSVKLFNKLPNAMHQMPYRRFCNALYGWLQKNPFYHLNEFYTSVKSIG
jgi:hypothetical protein